MGYEARIYAGTISRSIEENRGQWFHVCGMVEMSGCDIDVDLLLKKIPIVAADPSTYPTPIYFYGSDGNTIMTEDLYGKRLLAFPINKLIAVVKPFTETNYRRYDWAFAMLTALALDDATKHGYVATHAFVYGH